MAKRKARLSVLIERLKTDARLASDAARAEGRQDVVALLEGVKRSLRAAARRAGAENLLRGQKIR